MTELTVAEVAFALKESQANVDSALRRRIEWALGQGNYDWPEERLRDELSEFILQKNRSWSTSSKLSLDDFLCEKGISLKSYNQFIRSLNISNHQPSLLNKDTLNSLDCDSELVTFAQNHPTQDVFINSLRELGLNHNQCRRILGLGDKSYTRLKKRLQSQRKEEKIDRRGRSENDAWSFAKHVVSELCLRKFKEGNRLSIFVLETHQGIGDATLLYQRYGHVLGFENNEKAHQIIVERIQKSGFYQSVQDLYMKRPFAPEIDDFKIFVTEKATPCEAGLKTLVNQGLSFNVVDVDPWATSKPFFPEVNPNSDTEPDLLKVFGNSGLIMLTVGDQHPWPKGEPLAWERFGVDSYGISLSKGDKQTWRKTWTFLRLACAWYMRAAITRSVCLLPILIMRNFEPWLPRNDFSGGVMGVDRIYFVGKRLFKPDKLEQVLQFWTEPMPIFGNDMLRTQISTHTRPSGSLSFISFSEEIWPAMKPFWPKYYEWLLKTSEDLPSRWRRPELPEIRKARNQLRQAIEDTCSDKITMGYDLVHKWLNTL